MILAEEGSFFEIVFISAIKVFLIWITWSHLRNTFYKFLAQGGKKKGTETKKLTNTVYTALEW